MKIKSLVNTALALLISLFANAQVGENLHENLVETKDPSLDGLESKPSGEHNYVKSFNKSSADNRANLSAKATVFVLDSIITYETDTNTGERSSTARNLFEFDEQGNNTLYKNLVKDNDAWITYRNDQKTYDQNNNLTEHIFRNSKYDFSYNGKNQRTERVYFKRANEQSPWEPKSRYEFSYNAKDLLDQRVSLSWDDFTESYLNIEKIKYIYNDDNKVVKEVSYRYDRVNKQWSNEPSLNREYTYDDNDSLIKSVTLGWTERKLEWVYDSKGNLQLHLHYSREDTKWVKAYKEDYNYNSNGQVEQIRKFYWQDIQNQWFEYEKEEYGSDNFGNTIFEKYYSRDPSTNELVANAEISTEYDTTVLKTDCTLPDDKQLNISFSDQLFNKPIKQTSKFFLLPNKKWAQTSEINFYYSKYTSVGTKTLQKEEILFFPNPVNDCINFTLKRTDSEAKFSIYDLQGRQVLFKRIEENEQVNLSSLKKGIYLFQINNEQGMVQNGKFIKN